MKKFLIAALVVASCKTVQPVPAATASDERIIGGKLFATVFQQQAAEYKALCLQAYNIAALRTNEILAQPSTKPRAIITDIDETVLDNSPYAVRQGLRGKDYEPATWYEWTALAIADTVPGAPAFLKYAASRGVEIFYITNRDEREREGTLKNIQKFGLPNADNRHLVLRQGISSKEDRRKAIMADYDVILLIGDNLADFSALFEKLPAPAREANTDLSAAQFGKKFILLPNPVYGYWEDALYNYQRMTVQQRDSAIRASLKSY
ncbi:MAG TPA: 5'-nucleotidase, lipoprotein e(P4) family [Flavisolibacter sp.]